MRTIASSFQADNIVLEGSGAESFHMLNGSPDFGAGTRACLPHTHVRRQGPRAAARTESLMLSDAFCVVASRDAARRPCR